MTCRSKIPHTLSHLLMHALADLYTGEPIERWLPVDQALGGFLAGEGHFPIDLAAYAHDVDPELVWEALVSLILTAEGPHEHLSRTFR